MKICIFEDQGFKTLLPLVYHRPVYDLLGGTKTLRERIIDILEPDSVILHSRSFLRERVQELYSEQAVKLQGNNDPILFINGRVLMDSGLGEKFKNLGLNQLLMKDGIVLGGWIQSEDARRLVDRETINHDAFPALEKVDTDATVIMYLWELIQKNGAEITSDLAGNGVPGLDRFTVPDNCHQFGDHEILAGDNVSVNPGCVFDTSKGPIGLGKRVTVKSNSVLEGPLFVGEESIINSMTRIGSTTIDSVCKVGGEIHSTIMHSFSNKQHDGFLGDAYLGAWVNLGAGTNNSNLKNDYGTIQVVINGERHDSESQFVGLLMGDHSKSGIGSLFNTGTVIGTNCNIFGGGLPPQELPSFTWGSTLKRFTTYRLEKALRVAEIVMKRRNRELSSGEKKIFETVYRESEPARQHLFHKSGKQ